jgi:dihydrofolate reductase
LANAIRALQTSYLSGLSADHIAVPIGIMQTRDAAHGDARVAVRHLLADDGLGRRTNVGKVRTGLAVSLDGFIAGPNDGPEAPMGVGGDRLLSWYSAGDTEYRLPGTEMVFMVSAQTAEYLAETRRTTGALVFGRRTFDLTNGWGGKHPLDVPVFVVTSSVPQNWIYEGSPFTFVTDALESALDQAKAVAGDKDVGVGAASIVQQCIKAGLLDEIHVDLVHVLLGGGVSLFDHLGTGPIDLESTRVIEGTRVTHLTFRVGR